MMEREQPETEARQRESKQPKVIPELERLRGWAGRWTSDETFEKSPAFPNGGIAHGAGQVHLGPAGVIIEEYHSEGGPFGSFDGHLMITWDAKESVYKLYWFDTISPAGQVSKGSWEGEQLVFRGESKDAGHAWVMTFKDISENGRTLVSEMSMNGSPMTKAHEIRYTRAVGTAAAPTAH